jgi:hypothetical protein
MTSAHILYIPTIFMLGMLTGLLVKSSSSDHTTTKVDAHFISGKLLLGAFIVFAFVFAGTHFFSIPRSAHAIHHALNGAEIFDKSPSYTSSEVYSRIASFPSSGIYLYKQFTYTTDVLFPITLFTFLILLSKYLGQRARVSKRIQTTLTMLPIVWFGLDMAENAIVFNLLDNFPLRNDLLAGMLGYVTISKFTMLLLSIAIPALVKIFEKRFNNGFSRQDE